MNEKFAPDLLPVKSNLVECMLAQIEAMEANIATAKKGDFRISVHRMEVHIRNCFSVFFFFFCLQVCLRVSKFQAAQTLQREHFCVFIELY